MRIVRVKWLDALAVAGWTHVEEPLARQECVTVGFLVAEDADHVMIAGTYGEGYYNGAMMVPKGMIIEGPTDL